MVFLFAYLPAVLAVYYIVPKRFKNLFLFIASLFFYAWGEPKYVWLMIVSITAAYVTGLFADKEKYGKKKALIATVAAVVWNIALLLYFKYSDFFVINANSLFLYHVHFTQYIFLFEIILCQFHLIFTICS